MQAYSLFLLISGLLVCGSYTARLLQHACLHPTAIRGSDTICCPVWSNEKSGLLTKCQHWLRTILFSVDPCRLTTHLMCGREDWLGNLYLYLSHSEFFDANTPKQNLRGKRKNLKHFICSSGNIFTTVVFAAETSGWRGVKRKMKKQKKKKTSHKRNK